MELLQISVMEISIFETSYVYYKISIKFYFIERHISMKHTWKKEMEKEETLQVFRTRLFLKEDWYNTYLETKKTLKICQMIKQYFV